MIEYENDIPLQLVVFHGFFSYSCLEKEELFYPQFPDTDLKEIILRGTYYQDDPNERREQEKYMSERGYLKEGEKFEEHYPHIGQERFSHSYCQYCYRQTKDKKSIFKENLRARLYDKEGNLLAEDFLRLVFPERYDKDGRYSESFLKEINYTPEQAKEGLLALRTLTAYIPYHSKGYEIRIVRLKEEKEVIIEISLQRIPTKFELIEYYVSKRLPGREGYGFHEEGQCHQSPGPR